MKRKNCFVTAEEYKYKLDDEQYIAYRKLSEGQRQRYQSSVSRSFTLNQATGELNIPVDVGGDRRILLEMSICGWKLFRDDVVVEFNPDNLADFLENADPTIIDGLETKVREANTWMVSPASVGQVDAEIEKLEKIKKQAVGVETKKAT